MHVVQFTPDGHAACLYTELIPLATLGTMTIARASEIEWNNERAEWQVKVEGRIIFANASREACLCWEKAFFNNRYLDQTV